MLTTPSRVTLDESSGYHETDFVPKGKTHSSEHEDEEMGSAASRENSDRTSRVKGVTGVTRRKSHTNLPPNATKTSPEDYILIQQALGKLLLFARLSEDTQKRICSSMYEWTVPAGEILIRQGESGAQAQELYVVKKGKFEVLEKRRNVNVRVNVKDKGDCFGEIALMYNCPRTATVAAMVDSTVWVLERDVFRHFVKEAQESLVKQVELFLNSVPLLQPLSREDKLRLLDAMEEQQHPPGTKVILQGDPGSLFYIIMEGEAVVYKTTETGARKELNRLFKTDFFGERALLSDEPRIATVEAVTHMVCLTLRRQAFVEILGPLEKYMTEQKSEKRIAAHLSKLSLGPARKPGEKSSKHRIPAQVHIIRRRGKKKGEGEQIIRAVGHLDEVYELTNGEVIPEDGEDHTLTGEKEPVLRLVEGHVLGEGAFSRVSVVTEESNDRVFAMKRLLKNAVVQCSEHVFCEQEITRMLVHPFCLRQYCSFQDRFCLYFLFDLMQGGDLMDVLEAEVRVTTTPVGVKMLKGMEEDVARFYIATLVMSLDYLHTNRIVYRDLKPENVLLDGQGWAKLGDFGFAKMLKDGERTYTFCGTPGYIAPENVLGKGYNFSVDWWTLGVLMYVLLTGRQPFAQPKTSDPMEIMKRIVDENWPIQYPPYVSSAAKDLMSKLMERKPHKRLGMLQGRAADIKRHKWFQDVDWDALVAKRMEPPRKPKEADTAKRLQDINKKYAQDKIPQLTREELYECDMVFKNF